MLPLVVEYKTRFFLLNFPTVFAESDMKKPKNLPFKIDSLLSFLSPDSLVLFRRHVEDARFSGLGVTTCRAGSHGRVAFVTSGSIDGNPRRSLKGLR